MEIMTFVIEGHAEVGPPHDTQEADRLNEKADAMASTMEREIRRLMLPGGGITVQADLWFRPGGSVILEGSVILLCWAGRTALEPIREELANAIKTVTRRVLNRVVSALPSPLRPNFPTIDVTSFPPTRPDMAPTPTPPSTPTSTQQGALQGTIVQNQRWLIAVVGILGVLVLILLADRIVSASLPRNVYVLPTALSGVTPTPTAPPTPAPAPK